MKKCPYCAEEIQDEAIVCRYCGRELTVQPTPVPTPAPIPTPILTKPKTKTSPILIIFLAIVGICLFIYILSQCSSWFGGGGRPTLNYSIGGGGSQFPTTTPQQLTIIYRVTGNGSADLTLENASGNTEQVTVSLPYSKSFLVSPGAFLYISAQINGSGTVKCDILSNGVVIETATSSGEFVIASCSGKAR